MDRQEIIQRIVSNSLLSRDEQILAMAKEFHARLFKLYDDLGGDASAGFAVLALAKTMFEHFGSPDGSNRGRTSNRKAI